MIVELEWGYAGERPAVSFHFKGINSGFWWVHLLPDRLDRAEWVTTQVIHRWNDYHETEPLTESECAAVREAVARSQLLHRLGVRA